MSFSIDFNDSKREHFCLRHLISDEMTKEMVEVVAWYELWNFQSNTWWRFV